MRIARTATLIILVFLLAWSSPAEGQPFDLWIQEVRIETLGPSPGDGVGLTVVFRNQPGAVPPAPTVGAHVYLNGNPSPVATFALDAAPVETEYVELVVAPGDEITVIVDPADLLAEINENNNWLRKFVGDPWGGASCSPYPASLTIPDPDNLSQELTLECVEYRSQVRTGYFPWAMLTLPPYEWDESDPSGTMRTELSIGTFSGTENSQTTGLTAGIAIEASKGLGSNAEVAVGVEIEREWEEENALGTETSSAETFWAETTAGFGPLQGQPTVVVAQTTYDIAEYRVTTSGNWYDERFFIATPTIYEYEDNPELIQVGFLDYPSIKDPEAVELEAVHQVGTVDSYDYDRHGCDHVLHNGSRSASLLAKRTQQNIYGADWQISRQEYTSSSRTVTTSVNFYARGSVGGASVQASFGAKQGHSHKTWHGTETVYHWIAGPTLGVPFAYRMAGLAENLTFQHDPLSDGRVRTDRMLLLDYHMVERSYGWPWEAWEEALEWYLWHLHFTYVWPEVPTHGFPEVWVHPLEAPVTGAPVLYYGQLQDIAASLDAWIGEFPVVGIDDLRSEIDDFRNRTQDILDYDQDNSVYYDVMGMAFSEIMDDAGSFFMSNASWTEPAKPGFGEIVRIHYDPEGGTLPRPVAAVTMEWTDDGGGNWYSIPMDPQEQGQFWSIDIPALGEPMQYRFTDGSNTDDRGGALWKVPIGHPHRTHDNGYLQLCTTEWGTLGWIDDTHSDGTGFMAGMPPANRMNIGGLWVGGMGQVANRDHVADPAPEWSRDLEAPGVRLGQGGLTELGHAVFTDEGSMTPMGLRVEMGTLATAGSPMDEGFVILSYLVENVSDAPLPDIWVGQYADIDLDPLLQDQDIGFVHPSLDLVWLEQPGAPLVGLALLDAPESIEMPRPTLIAKQMHMDPAGFYDDMVKSELLMGMAPLPPEGVPDDHALLVSAGPWTLMPGESVPVTFALVTGNDPVELEMNASRAAEWIRPTPGPPTISVTAVAPTTPTASSVSLAQNSPNPFNPRTTIRFLNSADGRIRVAVYDLRGQLVREIANREYRAGPHEVEWDGRDTTGQPVASGVYICRAEGFGRSAATKMVLLK